jgi:hypothetical protein
MSAAKRSGSSAKRKRKNNRRRKTHRVNESQIATLDLKDYVICIDETKQMRDSK